MNMTPEGLDERVLSRRDFIKALTIITSGVSVGCRPRIPERRLAPPAPEAEIGKTFRGAVLLFDWEAAQDPKKLLNFTSLLAEQYVLHTGPTIFGQLNKTDVPSTTFDRSRVNFEQSVKKADPLRDPLAKDDWAVMVEPGKVFVDLSSLEEDSKRDPSKKPHIGLRLMGVLWEAWGYLDRLERKTGELINNPDFSLDTANDLRVKFDSYRGLEAITEHGRLFSRFDEVWNSMIAVKRMEAVLEVSDPMYVSGQLWRNGVDVLMLLTNSHSIYDLYKLRGESDFEATAQLLGGRLPGTGTPLDKGLALITAIDNNRRDELESTGVFGVIPPTSPLPPTKKV